MENIQQINETINRGQRRRNRHLTRRWNRPHWTQEEQAPNTHCQVCHKNHHPHNPYECYKFPGLEEATCAHCHQGDWNFNPIAYNPWLALVDSPPLTLLTPIILYFRDWYQSLDYLSYRQQKLVDLVLIIFVFTLFKNL